MSADLKDAHAKFKDEGHRRRLRERFRSGGLDGFLDYEVIELLLTLGQPRKDCKQQAKDLLTRFKTLQGVLEAPVSDLCQIPGIGPSNSFGIKLVKAVADRYLKQRIIRKETFSNSAAVLEYLQAHLGEKKQEHFEALFLDAKNGLIAAEVLFSGTLTSSSVYPREVVRLALAHHAAAIIFAHNHPSGDPTPSPEDIAVTRTLIAACRLVGVTVHEHLVIAGSRYFSFADQGYIARLNRECEPQPPGSHESYP